MHRWVLAVLVLAGGCRTPRHVEMAARPDAIVHALPAPRRLPEVAQVDFQTPTTEVVPAPTAEPALENPAAPVEGAKLPLDSVVQSVRLHFPLVQSAVAGRQIASGQRLEASGNFDTKFKVASESQPLGFYETYRNATGVERYTMGGGTVFGGYRIGRGSFEPWYLERQTNDGGEFKAGFLTPLAQDRWIDPRRAELWRAEIEQNRIEPEIRAVLIGFTRDASQAYWLWVAAGENYRIAERLLDIARTRNRGLEIEVDRGERAEIDLVDNRRLIVEREAKTIDARRKLDQAAIKLSLFLRGSDGTPVVPTTDMLPTFPDAVRVDDCNLAEDVQFALARRPELMDLNLQVRQLEVDLAQARNLARPMVNSGLIASQDVGEPTSSKRDKSQLELEAGMYVEVPLERRKALGKQQQLQGKLTQVRAKQRFAADKITTEVQLAQTALVAAYQQVERADESLQLARRMQEAEQRGYDLGESDLFKINAREKQTAEAAEMRVATLFEYFAAAADYEAALGANIDAPAMASGEVVPE